MAMTRKNTGVSVGASGMFWQKNLENVHFTASDHEWTDYGPGLPVYPIKRKSDGATLAYLQYPTGNLLCKTLTCLADGGKFVDST